MHFCTISEGISVAMPIYYATGEVKKGFWIAFWSGIAEPIGALVGWAILNSMFSETVFGILFGVVGGIMVFISFNELIPEAFQRDPHNHLVTFWLVVGFVVMDISLIVEVE